MRIPLLSIERFDDTLRYPETAHLIRMNIVLKVLSIIGGINAQAVEDVHHINIQFFCQGKNGVSIILQVSCSGGIDDNRRIVWRTENE